MLSRAALPLQSSSSSSARSRKSFHIQLSPLVVTRLRREERKRRLCERDEEKEERLCIRLSGIFLVAAALLAVSQDRKLACLLRSHLVGASRPFFLSRRRPLQLPFLVEAVTFPSLSPGRRPLTHRRAHANVYA